VTDHNHELEIRKRYIEEDKKAQVYVKEREGKSKRVAIVITPEKVSSWDFPRIRERKSSSRILPCIR
jgi:hypothetical protein